MTDTRIRYDANGKPRGLNWESPTYGGIPNPPDPVVDSDAEQKKAGRR